LAWEKSRGIGVWILQVDWDNTLPTATTRPDFVSRTLRVLGADLPFPGDVAARATVAAAPAFSKGLESPAVAGLYSVSVPFAGGHLTPARSGGRRKYAAGVLPKVRRNMEMNALGVL
jgi:hypothetical protein